MRKVLYISLRQLPPRLVRVLLVYDYIWLYIIYYNMIRYYIIYRVYYYIILYMHLMSMTYFQALKFRAKVRLPNWILRSYPFPQPPKLGIIGLMYGLNKWIKPLFWCHENIYGYSKFNACLHGLSLFMIFFSGTSCRHLNWGFGKAPFRLHMVNLRDLSNRKCTVAGECTFYRWSENSDRIYPLL